MISRSSSNTGHVGSKTRSQGQIMRLYQNVRLDDILVKLDYGSETQVSELGPSLPSCFTDSYRENALNVFTSETTGPVKAKFHMHLNGQG